MYYQQNYFFQLMVFITATFSVYLLLEVLSKLLMFIIFVIKYNTIYLKVHKVSDSPVNTIHGTLYVPLN